MHLPHAGPPDAAASERLLALHLVAAVRRFGASALAVVDLPPLTEGGADASQLRVGAVLYWCMSLEEAGLPAVGEALVEAWRSGRLAIDVGPVAERLEAFARRGGERFTREERAALYARVFDDGFHDAFARLMAALDEAGRSPDGLSLHAEVAIGTLAKDVADMVSSRTVGMAAFAAREIVVEMRAVWGLLQSRELQAALMARSAWDVVRAMGPRLVGTTVPADVANARAEAGRVVLAWLADAANSLSAGRVAPPRAVLEAAARWTLVNR